MLKASYPIPAGALDDRLGWVGTAGSGKTYNASAGVEHLLAAGARCIIIDPLDVWWGLRLALGGNTPSPFTLPIFGGVHGDLPLNEGAGALIGETVAGMAESCIVSLGGLPTKSAERRFMLAFLDALYRKANGEPVHLIFDEADLWAPQKSSEPLLQSLMEQIVRRGRIKGLIPWLITQRPAVISKDVLSQVDGLIAFKLTSSQDRDAIGAWIEGQADRQQGRDILASLPTKQQGEGVIWIPGRGILTAAAFPPKATFDSSRTPKRGEKRAAAGALKPLDLGALKERLANVDAEAKANDPRALKAEITRLKADLVKMEKMARTAITTAPPPAPVIDQEALDAARREGERAGIAIGLARARSALDSLGVDDMSVVQAKTARAPTIRREAAAPIVASEGVSGPCQRILNAIAWWNVFGIANPSNEQAAFIAGYSPTSTGYTNPRGALRSAGLIEYPSPGAVTLTASGRALATAPDAVPSREELHRRVLGKLGGPQQRILQVALAAYPDGLSNTDVAERAGYSHTSTGYTNPRGALRTLSLIDYPAPGQVRAADWLFP